jgi:hypothetical protein
MLCQFWYIFPRFGILCHEKSGNPDVMCRKKVCASFFAGLKDTLFDEYLFEDAIYLVVALMLISLSILFYTRYGFVLVLVLVLVLVC